MKLQLAKASRSKTEARLKGKALSLINSPYSKNDKKSLTTARSLSAATPGWVFRDIVFRSPTSPFLGRRMEEYGLSDRQSTDASERAANP